MERKANKLKGEKREEHGTRNDSYTSVREEIIDQDRTLAREKNDLTGGTKHCQQVSVT